MKKTKRIITALFCSFLMLVCKTAVYAEKPIGNYTYECFTYNLNSDNSITIISCDSAVTDVTIPDEINGNPVVAVNGSTFQGCNELQSITVSETNQYFFVNNAGMLMNKAQTKLIKCPQSLNIYSYSIHDTVKSISPYCFENCKSLEYIYIPETVTSIGKFAFSGTSFSNITLTNSSTVIGEKAFGFNVDGKIEGFTLYGETDSTAETYASESEIAFVPSNSGSFNVAINGNLYFYNSDASFSGEKIKVTNSNGADALYTFSKTPSAVYEENGANFTKIDLLTILGNTITSVNVRVAMPGDANADGKLNVRDAAFIASCLAKGERFAGFDKMCADKNKDKKADIRDAAEIARELATGKNS